jgi:hypothetical protein
MKTILLFIIFSALLLSGCGGPGTNATANNANSGTIGNTNGMSFKKSLPQGFNEPADNVGRRLLKEYGAVFVAGGGTAAPKTVVFKDEKEVAAFQAGVQISKEHIGDFDLELQTPAMNALKTARGEAEARGLTITPRSGDSARRNYGDTVGLWASRVEPALVHWVGQSKLDQAEADRIRGLTPYEQVPEVFKLESQGLYFAKDLSKSIIYSVAPPGTSQHLSMLALDVAEFQDPKVREILAKNGWYQTVVSDLPHFTYLGVPENELTGRGLRKQADGAGRVFWVPDI